MEVEWISQRYARHTQLHASSVRWRLKFPKKTLANSLNKKDNHPAGEGSWCAMPSRAQGNYVFKNISYFLKRKQKNYKYLFVPKHIYSYFLAVPASIWCSEARELPDRDVLPFIHHKIYVRAK
jgi:hypothetical protein